MRAAAQESTPKVQDRATSAAGYGACLRRTNRAIRCRSMKNENATTIGRDRSKRTTTGRAVGERRSTTRNSAIACSRKDSDSAKPVEAGAADGENITSSE